MNAQIDVLERQYLARIAKLLIMAQTHCEIKDELNELFDSLGVSHNYTERDVVEHVVKN